MRAVIFLAFHSHGEKRFEARRVFTDREEPIALFKRAFADPQARDDHRVLCWHGVGGQGSLDYSEGLEGLPRALYIAGAQNVLAALWPVGDTAARDFMMRFYDTWLSQEISDPAAALRQTKLWYLAQQDPRITNPENWAPFVLFEG